MRQLPLHRWQAVPASSLVSPGQLLWHKHILSGPAASCIMPLHPTMSFCIPLLCQQRRAHLFFPAVLVQWKATAFLTSLSWLI